MDQPQNLIDQLRWKKIPVLDDGFVCLVDVMGDDPASCRRPASATAPAPGRSPTTAR